MKMPMHKSKNNTGSALIIVMIVLLAGVGIISIMFSSSDQMIRSNGIRKRLTRLKYVAEGGINLAHADMGERGLNRDFTSVSLPSHLLPGEHENAGLTRSIPEDRSTIKPRFYQTTSDGIRLEVYYFPTEDSAEISTPFNDYFPKFFQIVSRAKSLKTGATYSVESMFYLQPQGSTSLAYGILNPTLPPNNTKFYFAPIIIDGHMHFGPMDPANTRFEYYWGQGWPSNDPDDPKYHYTFKGPVTFGSAIPSGMDHPFDKSPYNDMTFEKGYISEFSNAELGIDIPAIYTEVVSNATIDLCPASEPDICLEMTTGGTVYKYGCNVGHPDPEYRYLGEVPAYTAGVTTGVYNGDQIFKCEGGDIHIKGIYEANYTFVAENIVIEGDIVNADQSTSSPYKLGVVAQNDLVVPAGVPWFRYNWWGAGGKEDWPNHYLTNVTNYLVPGSEIPGASDGSDTGNRTDRDYADPEYYEDKVLNWNPYYQKQGQHNVTFVLDTDMSAVAGGEIKMDGIWNHGDLATADAQIVYYDRTGGKWDPFNMGETDSYYVSGTRVTEPLACSYAWGAPAGTSCPSGKEIARQQNESWVNFGSLVVDNYSHLRYKTNWIGKQGFARIRFKQDPRVISAPPSGFPQGTRIAVQKMWSRNYEGNSPSLKALNIN